MGNSVLFMLLFFSQHTAASLITFKQINSDKTPINKRINSMTVDHHGFVWLAAGASLWRYDGNKLKSFEFIVDKNIKHIKKLHFSANGEMWIGTTNNGLIRHHRGITQFIQADKDTEFSAFISTIADGSQGDLWIGTDKGLNHLSSTQSVDFYPHFDASGQRRDLYVTSIFDASETFLLVGTKQGLYRFHKRRHTFEKVALFGEDDFIIFTIYQDINDVVWLGTQKGVFRRENDQKFSAFMPEIFDHSIPAIRVDQKNIWVGSFTDGLYRISQKTGAVKKYKYDVQDSTSISNDNIIAIVGSDDGQVWINTYSGGVNYFNTSFLNFGRQNNGKNSVLCAQSREFNDFDEHAGFLWVSSTTGLVKLKLSDDGITKNCQIFQTDQQGNHAFTNKSLRSTTFSADGQGWLATTKGLNRFNPSTGIIDTSYESLVDEDVFFIHERKDNELLLGTIKGLYVFDPQAATVTAIKSAQKRLNNAKVYWYAQTQNFLYLATNQGVARYDGHSFSIDEKVQSQLSSKEVLTVFVTKNNELLVGTRFNGLFHFDQSGRLIKHGIKGLSDNISIYSMIPDWYGRLWLGTDDGLAMVDLKKNQGHVFHKSDGLQGETFDINAAYNGLDGRLYFGGLNGFNAFYAGDVLINDQAPAVVLTDFFRFGKSVKIASSANDFTLDQSINDIDHLMLTHKDYVIGFEFAALDYADASRNRYAYKLEGLDPDWNTVASDDRKISYSNLQPGDYTFKVKAANKDGVWNEQGKQLRVTVLPAPWLSWWAYVCYFVVICGFFFLFIQRKNRANRKVTTLLRTEVKKQTKQLQSQKNKVETLLAEKNELFANVSHEFRTPLTLILGPVNELLKSHLPHKDIEALKMIQRNANHLLGMIEQLLQLAKTVDKTTVDFHLIASKPVIESIVQAFQHLAKDKKIALQLMNNDAAAIKVTDDALTIVLGNLLSNAIKYTPTGGHIEVNAEKTGQQLIIKVIDSGCGLDAQQQQAIFERFKRLESHQNINGIGIGLSVVKDVLKVNKGQIEIVSEVGQGSTFIVRLMCSDEALEPVNAQSDGFLLKQLTTELPQPCSVQGQFHVTKDLSRETVLIIEDNHDMRRHIAELLSKHYDCLLAEDGKTGIALAIQHIPDVIVCDVMMPEMDGFHVSRVIRSDTRTSHIPLVLLTALEDSDSRIRGWREHVDAYVTKPFEAQELLLQLENIIVIRNILKKKAAAVIEIGQGASHVDLSKKDQQFIDKLNTVIIKNYQDPGFLRPQMASAMALSERQLQRKVKALIDKNPIDLLREYRLGRAADKLKGGFQVGVISDECGFNSVTYFSRCFKAQYGMAPKVYQKSCQR